MPDTYRLADTAVTRIQNALDYIHTHPDEWDQGSWIVFIDENGDTTGYVEESDLPACGTAACLAGRIALQSGAPFAPADGVGNVWADMLVVDGHQVSVENYVCGLLFNGAQIINSTAADDYTCDFHALTSSPNNEHNLWYYGQFMTDNRLTVPEGIEPSPFEVEEEDVSF